MSAFNFDPAANIHVETNDDNVKVRFGGDTLGFNATTNGFSVTNDWNNRHFTLGFDENSILYHITREDIDDRTSGKGNIPPEEFVAEIYGYIRSLARPVPEDHLDLDFVGAVDVNEIRTYLEEHEVLHDTKYGLQIDGEKKTGLIAKLNDDGKARGEFYQQVLDPVAFEDAKSGDSGENIFVYPTKDEIFVLFIFPDRYIGVTTVRGVIGFATIAGGSQVMDHVLRAMSIE